MELKVIAEKCTACGSCQVVCPFGAIEVKGDVAVVFETCVSCGICVEACPAQALVLGELAATGVSLGDYRNVWVFAEQRAGMVTKVARQLVGKANELAGTLGAKAVAVLMGHNVEGLAEELIRYGADEVLLADHPMLENYRTDAYTKVLANLIQEKKPEIVLFGATHIGRDLAAAKTGLQTAAATLRREYTAEAQRLGFQHRAMVEMGKQLRKTDLSSFRAQIDAALAVGENDPQEEVIAKALALRAFSRRDAAQRAWAQFGEMFAARDPEADRYARIARQFNRELERLKVDFGVYVVRVADAEPAQAGGLTPGDIIIACDGRPVESFRLFLAADGAPAGNKPREVVVLRLGPSGAFSRQTLRIRALPPSDALLPI